MNSSKAVFISYNFIDKKDIYEKVFPNLLQGIYIKYKFIEKIQIPQNIHKKFTRILPIAMVQFESETNLRNTRGYVKN